MSISVRVFVFIFLLSTMAFSQRLSREQKLQKIDELNNRIKDLETDVLLPDVKDLEQARKGGVEVFRLMPRELYDHKLTVQGGGAFYSFTTKSHDYQKISQIGLEQNFLKVGFSGADYGFIVDLGNILLADVNVESSEINFLYNYKPPTIEPEVRVEQRKSYNYETENVTYRSRVPVNLGHTYALRAISFGQADTLVAFKIYRKDTDGSLIIFWKLLENFDKPILIRNQQAVLTDNARFISTSFSGSLAARIEEGLRKRGFNDVKVREEGRMIVLRGTVPKGKLAEVVQYAQEINKGPVKNEITEK